MVGYGHLPDEDMPRSALKANNRQRGGGNPPPKEYGIVGPNDAVLMLALQVNIRFFGMATDEAKM